jgi:SNF2 family DNA or RNA helicase
VASAVTANKAKGGMLKALHALRKVSVIAAPIGMAGMTDDCVQSSARLRAMVQVLDQVNERGEKALIFVEFLDLQDCLIPYLQKRYDLPVPPMRISGSVSGLKRKDRVDTFQSTQSGKFDVMLLSPKAGGVGLTLTAANHVIHLTRWWNPAVEDQCTDRVYRIGQDKAVHIYLPMAIHPEYGKHSLDKNLHQLLETKRKLSRSVLSPPAITDSDISRLFERSIYM